MANKIGTAKLLRKQDTPSEQIVWETIRNRKLLGLKFRRQHAINDFVVDFYCPDLKLALEIDGKIHENQREYDALRQKIIESESVEFLRVNSDVVENSIVMISNWVENHKNLWPEKRLRPSPLHSFKNGEGLGVRALLVFLLSYSFSHACFPLARLKYGGGGDWYAGPTMLPNLAKRLRADLGIDVCPGERTVEPWAGNLYETPVLFMTGHGNFAFTEEERPVIREFLRRGGLLFADDNYGLAESFRAEMKILFPQRPLRPLPAARSIFHSHFNFPRGLPKIHQHDGKPATAYGIEIDGRIAVLFTYECDLGNGWEDHEVYNDPIASHEQALRMGVNIFAWFLEGARAK